MIFEKTFGVLKEIRRRNNLIKDRVKKQRDLAADIVPYKAKMNSTLKIINMLLEKTQDIKSITIRTDPNSETLVNNFIEEELSDYIVKKNEENPIYFDIKSVELSI